MNIAPNQTVTENTIPIKEYSIPSLKQALLVLIDKPQDSPPDLETFKKLVFPIWQYPLQSPWHLPYGRRL
ncbi:hypothetical protein JTE90_006760 [Oedothorax gibbosus]|uniref:Uncharacterized protein n=1 Tax=Oedothorax gibbosus TaxID=931172 RepID=A0AAV6UIZ6_9ARAC|nr:hypothetical protein JTE90_006760 [Oedothorax gibbosus]